MTPIDLANRDGTFLIAGSGSQLIAGLRFKQQNSGCYIIRQTLGLDYRLTSGVLPPSRLLNRVVQF
jgi:hypothetical protein